MNVMSGIEDGAALSGLGRWLPPVPRALPWAFTGRPFGAWGHTPVGLAPRFVAELHAQFVESAKLEQAIRKNLKGLGHV